MSRGESKKNKLSIVLTLCMLAYMTAYMSRKPISVLATALRDHGILTTAEYGFVGSVFFFTYAICKLFVGIANDRLKPEYMISLGIIVAGFSNLMIGLFPTKPVIFFFWFLNAVGQSLPWGAMLIAVVGADGRMRKEIRMSLLGIACSLGDIAGIVVVSRAYTSGGLKLGFALPGILTFITGFVVIFFLRTDVVQSREKSSNSAKSILKDRTIKHLFVPILIHGMIKTSVGYWLVAYVISCFGIDISKISLYVFFVPLVSILSRTLFPFLFRLFGNNEIKVAYFSYLMVLIVAIPLCFNVGSIFVAIACFCLITIFEGFSGTSFIAMLPARYAGRNQTGRVAGVLDFIIYMGSALSSFCFGIVVERWGYAAMFSSWEALIVVSLTIMTIFFRKKIMDD